MAKIVALAELEGADNVLEIGPGIGTLTMALLQNAKHVTSIERDTDLPAVLAETLEPWWDSFTLIQKDALDLQLSDLDGKRPPTSWWRTCRMPSLPRWCLTISSASSRLSRQR